MRINNTKIILTTFICLLSSLFVKAADETVTMKVGATKTLYLPSYVTSKAIYGSQWTSTRPDEIAVVSQTSYSVTIKAIKSVPSSTTCLAHCQYYYLQAIGTFTYMTTGIYDFKILTESIKPISISLPSSVTLDVGKSKYLTPIIVLGNAETNLEWSSSQYSIINVFQNGRILAQRQGTSVITVKTSNGLYASCTVTAVKPNVDVTSIKVSPASYTIDVGERYTLTATLQPSDATDKTVRWSSNSPNVVRVDNNGTITGVSCGNAIITANSSNGRTSACTVTCANPVPDIVISESDGLSKIPTIANVRYEKTFYKGWNSVCLPFAIDAKIFGSQDLQIAMVNDVEVVGNKRTVSYEFVEQVGAGVACLIHVPEDMTFKIFLSNTNLVSEPDTKGPLVGTFTETVIGEGCYKLASDGQSFAQTKTASAVYKSFRAYIKK